MGDLGKDEEVGKNGDARQRASIGKDTKIRNLLACEKTYALSCCLKRGAMIGRPEQAAEGLE